MPQTELMFFQDDEGSVPVREWLLELQRKNRRAFAKCVDKIGLLHEQGYELRRPHADILRDGIYELRARSGNVNYRICIFFMGKTWLCWPIRLRMKPRFLRPISSGRYRASDTEKTSI